MRFSRLALARPRPMLLDWALLMLALVLVGTGVESRLTQNIFVLPGSETAKSLQFSTAQFGESVFVPILLEGPARAIDRQGPELVVALEADQGTRVLSPWDRGQAAETLRPRPRAAMILAAVSGPYKEIFDSTAERVQATVEAEIKAPVEARVTGQPIIGNAIKNETYDSAREAELIAIPVLMVVLLLVFRAPIAALIPGLVGLACVYASSGVIWLLTHLTPVDPLAISLASMMSLALGVDYLLLIVTRFREEIALQPTRPKRATRLAMVTAEHPVAFAGSALVVAMLVGILVSPGSILVSASIGVITATVLGLVSAFVAIPAALVLLGLRVVWLHLGRKRPGQARWLAPVRGALRHPGLVTIVVVAPLLWLSAPALGLDTAPPAVGELPESDPARQDFERVAEVMGSGWAAPFEVLLVARDGTIIERDKLGPIERYQRRLATSDKVASVIGPGNLAPASGRARQVGPQLTRAQRGLDRGIRGLGRLS